MKKPMTKHSITSGIAIIGTIVVGICHFARKSSATVQNTLSSTADSTVCFKGVPLSDLSELAKNVYHGISCTIDKYGFLNFHYKSNRGRQTLCARLTLNDAGKLKNLSNCFPNQLWSGVDAFLKEANEKFTFTK